MILLSQGSGLADRTDVGHECVLEGGRKVKESELDWKDNPQWAGRQYAIVNLAPRKRVMFERDKP